MGMRMLKRDASWHWAPVIFYDLVTEREKIERLLDPTRDYMAALRGTPEFREEAERLIEEYGTSTVEEGWSLRYCTEEDEILRGSWEEAQRKRDEVFPEVSDEALRYRRALLKLAGEWDLGKCSVAAYRAGQVVKAILVGTGEMGVSGGCWTLEVVRIELPGLVFRLGGVDFGRREVQAQIGSIVEEMVEEQLRVQRPTPRVRGVERSWRNARLYAMHKGGMGPKGILEKFVERYPDSWDEYGELDEEIVKSAVRDFRGYLRRVDEASAPHHRLAELEYVRMPGV